MTFYAKAQDAMKRISCASLSLGVREKISHVLDGLPRYDANRNVRTFPEKQTRLK